MFLQIDSGRVLAFDSFAAGQSPRARFVIGGVSTLSEFGRSLVVGSFYGDSDPTLQLVVAAPTETQPSYIIALQSGVC